MRPNEIVLKRELDKAWNKKRTAPWNGHPSTTQSVRSSGFPTEQPCGPSQGRWSEISCFFRAITSAEGAGGGHFLLLLGKALMTYSSRATWKTESKTGKNTLYILLDSSSLSKKESVEYKCKP